MKHKTIPIAPLQTMRTDRWWVEPALLASGLMSFIAYASWAAFQNQNYYSAPYISPFHSPCISGACPHVSAPVLGSWGQFSPALLVLWIPGGLRLTCYYYRKAYYRSLFLSPAACAVSDASLSYSGESRWPLRLQNLHRYFFYLSLPLLAALWWDAVLAMKFQDGWGVGVGTIVIWSNVLLLSLFMASCNSCRHLCGGGLKSLHAAPRRFRIWRALSKLNARHGLLGWLSLASVCITDLYIRMLATASMTDFRLF